MERAMGIELMSEAWASLRPQASNRNARVHRSKRGIVLSRQTETETEIFPLSLVLWCRRRHPWSPPLSTRTRW
jgi:hypothetical protein